MQGMDCGDSLFGWRLSFGKTRQPMGRTPAHDGTTSVNLNHGVWFGSSRIGRSEYMSVDDFK
eukprot:557803-Pleurochrysis_carterae.AAC.1